MIPDSGLFFAGPPCIWCASQGRLRSPSRPCWWLSLFRPRLEQTRMTVSDHCFPFGCRLCCRAWSLGRLVPVLRLVQCVAHCDVPRDALSLFPRKQFDTVRSLPISSKQAWRLFQRRDVRLRNRSPHQVVQTVMPCRSTVAPSARQTILVYYAKRQPQ